MLLLSGIVWEVEEQTNKTYVIVVFYSFFQISIGVLLIRGSRTLGTDQFKKVQMDLKSYKVSFLAWAVYLHSQSISRYFKQNAA